MKKIDNNTTQIVTDLGTYVKALVTLDHVYFVNFEESDENGAVMMYRNNEWTLVSNNYFAFVGIMQALESEPYVHIHPMLKMGFLEMLENDYEEITNDVELSDFDDGFTYTIYTDADEKYFFAKSGETVHRYKLTKSIKDIRREDRAEVLKYRYANLSEGMEVQLDDVFMHGEFVELIK